MPVVASQGLPATYARKYKSPAALIRISVGVYIIEEPQQEGSGVPSHSAVFQWSPNVRLHYSATPLRSRMQTAVCHLIAVSCLTLSLSRKQTLPTKRFTADFLSIKLSVETEAIDKSFKNWQL